MLSNISLFWFQQFALDPSFVAMAVNYCTKQRHLSTKILDAAALHFEQYGHKYSPVEAYLTLRVYGQLNYLPPNASQMFDVVEQILSG